MVESLDWVDRTFDFETYLSGHGPQANVMGDRQDLRDHRQYYIDLMAAVRAAQAAGLADNSEEMMSSVRTALEPRYGTWASFPSGLFQSRTAACFCNYDRQRIGENGTEKRRFVDVSVVSGYEHRVPLLHKKQR